MSSASVSSLTMQGAVAELRAEGVLCTHHRYGISIVGLELSKSPASSQRRPPRWRRTALSIEQDLTRGLFPSGSALPPAKTLGLRYGVCFRTLRKALHALEQSGWVETRLGKIVVPRQSRAGAGHTILLVAAGDTTGSIRPATTRLQELFRTLENECTQSNVALAPLAYASWDDMLLAPGGTRLSSVRQYERFGSVLGFVFWNMAMPRPEHYSAMIQRLVDTGLPVAVLDETAELVSRNFANTRRLSLFSMASSPLAGEAMGEYLYKLGHRRVAYISNMHEQSWSQNRLFGLRRAFSAHSESQGVVGVTSQGIPYGDQTARRIDELFKERFEPLFGQIPGNQLLPEQASELVAQMRGMATSSLHQEMADRDMLQLMERSLGESHVTAWVAANDLLALTCHRFLAQRAIHVPQHLSVVGFDDGLDAFLNKLTSYNFNVPAVTRCMVGSILGTGRSDRQSRGVGVTEIPGFINERGSTATLQPAVRAFRP